MRLPTTHKRKILVIASLLSLIISTQLLSCRKSEIVLDENFAFIIPTGWPQPFYNFEQNPVSKERFELGRKLFYDKQLSINNSISCGTCHQQFAAFAQIDHDISHGIFDRVGARNSPAIFNMNWNTSFFWDGRANHIEVQPLNPITDHNEMGETIENVVVKLSADARYKPMFQKAYGDETVSSQRILKALAQFMGMMVSDRSKYDLYKQGKASLSAQEQSGLLVFEAQCATCHKAPLFSDFSFRSNGLPLILNSRGVIDSGKAAVPPFAAENLYKFKVPSLRNLKYTRPYMHDGRYTTLEQVLDHYAQIDPNAVNLDPLLQNRIILSPVQRADLLAFLNTLNDEAFVKDKRFAEVQ
ncbi:cytochrome-c peroxidase [Taibaiella sp. KBW10]|uniref:cytochrome-c peroxidase n=1 Tax=Taibaiella sp. KBW10 TaxID=2153357 RepID=UPI000F596F5F|nr:cytochrome c peroxidase [Taibaiella sp. KBW10]RQO29804.1 cytochrome-c peroxidase [Taibaiella sp. KBW10]